MSNQVANAAKAGSDYTADEREFLSAMDEYKRRSGRKFPTWTEVLATLKAMGYRRNDGETSEPQGETRQADASERPGQYDEFDQLHRRIAELGDPASTILRMRLGIGHPKPMTLAEVGEAVGMDRDGVRRVEIEAFASLRAIVGA